MSQPGRSAGKGLPIGNHTSQFFANVYLNELDQFVKRKLKIQFYIRYVDDMVLLHGSRERLVQWKAEIAKLLETQLGLSLNERRSRIATVSSGIDFLGYVSRPRYRLLRRRVAGNLVRRLESLSESLVVDWRGYDWLLYRPGASVYLEAMLASYGAMLDRGDCFRLKRRIVDRFPFLSRIRFRSGQKPFWRTRTHFPRFSSQVRRFHEAFEGALIGIEVGRFLEFHGPQADLVYRLLGLKIFEGRRGGFDHWSRLPRDRCAMLLDAARQAGVKYVVMVCQEEPLAPGDVYQRRAVAVGRMKGS